MRARVAVAVAVAAADVREKRRHVVDAWPLHGVPAERHRRAATTLVRRAPPLPLKKSHPSGVMAVSDLASPAI